MHPQFRERNLVLRTKTDADLLSAINAIEFVFRNVYKEEGDAEIYFDLTDFPPKQLHETSGLNGLEIMLTQGALLAPFQRKALKPFAVYGGKPYYLLGNSGGDGDQLIPFLDEVFITNKNFTVLAIYAGCQTPSYCRERHPVIGLRAQRYGRTQVNFQLAQGLFKARKGEDEEEKMAQILEKTRGTFKQAYEQGCEIKSFEELLKDRKIQKLTFA